MNQYGNWAIPWLAIGKNHTAECLYDKPKDGTSAVFECTLKIARENIVELVEEFTCLATRNSMELEKILVSCLSHCNILSFIFDGG